MKFSPHRRGHVAGPINRRGPVNRRGSVVALVCVLLPALLLIMAYCVHVAHVESMHSRTQIVSDVIARSAGRHYVRTGDREGTLAIARQAAQLNPVGGVAIPVNMSDIEFGISDRDGEKNQYSFNALPADHDGEPGNSVRFSSTSLRDSTTAVLPNLFPNFGSATEIRPLKVAANTQGSLDISIVLDRSGSMRYASDEYVGDGSVPPAAQPADWEAGDPVEPPSRWHDTVSAVEAFMDYLDQSSRREKVCLSTYATDSTTDLRLTTDVNKVSDALKKITDEFHGGWTAIGLGMAEGLAALTDPDRNRSWAVRVMVLMTDGIHNTDVDPEVIATQLNDKGVTLFTITFGAGADQARMDALAKQCGGEHFHAANGTELAGVFQSIGRRLPSLLTQ